MFCMRHLVQVRSMVSLLLFLAATASAAQDTVPAQRSRAFRITDATLLSAETIEAIGTDGQPRYRQASHFAGPKLVLLIDISPANSHVAVGKQPEAHLAEEKI